MMTPVEAIEIAEGVCDRPVEVQTEAWQYLIDSGLAWTLQGFFGRQAMALIEAGVCHRKAG